MEVYEITTEEEFTGVGQVLIDGYSRPFNSFWEMLKSDKPEDDVLTRLWQWHAATPGSHWIGARRADGSKETVGLAQWILHETNPYEKGNPILPVYWLSDVYLTDITQQVFNTFFGGRPKLMSRPHVLLNICCVAQNARRQGAGRVLMKWGRDLANSKGLESFVEATFDGIRLYEAAGFTQVEPFVVDARIPDAFNNDKDGAAWRKARDRVLPTAYPGMVMWRPNGADWKQGDKYSWEVEA